MEVYPFKIIHLDITSPPAFVAPLSESGIYFVFWWNNLPVGDWYAEKGNHYDEEYLGKKICECTSDIKSQYLAPNMDRYVQTEKESGTEVDVSVVICTRNRTDDLEKCLMALGKQRYPPREIIVVDNAPENNGTKTLVRNFKKVKYLLEPHAGLDIARNTGAKNAISSVVAYTDDDVVPHPLWTFHVNDSFRNPSVTAMTGLVIAGELETESQQLFEKYWSFNRGYVDKIYDETYFKKHFRDGPPVWEIGAGANMAFRKSVLNDVGYFDERLDVGAAGCSGDSEMWFRILARLDQIHYNPRAVTFHFHRRELPHLRRQIFYYMRGFAAAALIQQENDRNLGYRRRVFMLLPKYFLKRLIKSFPKYSSKNRTLFAEITGLFSGIAYYYRNK